MGKPLYFVSTVYHRDEDGGHWPVMPEVGPCGDSEATCVLGLKDWRERTTGPGFPLAVIGCKTHGVYFTLYPPGHVPYGRVSFAELALNGTPVEKGRGPPFGHTYFDAALDAAAGIQWPKSSSEGSMQARFITQCRHMERCSLIFGLRKKMERRGKVAEQLGIGGFLLEEARHRLLVDGGFGVEGQAICQVLNVLEETEPIFQRLATCGHYDDIWPQIQRWRENHYNCSGPGNGTSLGKRGDI